MSQSLSIRFCHILLIKFSTCNLYLGRRRKIEVPTDSHPKFELGDTDGDIERRRREREEREKQEQEERERER